MAVSSLDRFRSRLALAAYFYDLFGVGDLLAPGRQDDGLLALSQQLEHTASQGPSHVVLALLGRASAVGEAKLLEYDENVRHHMERINRHRAEPVTLKYFQQLAALITECYLDRLTRDADQLLRDLNDFVRRRNQALPAHAVRLPVFGREDLNKVAFWMATGSGKTLLMHLNYYQYLHYRTQEPENILLVTTNEGMSDQHIGEMEKSGIPCCHFSASTNDLFGRHRHLVKVIEITKLVEEKAGSGESVEVASFEGPNLVFVDEGHKGTGSEAQAWRRRRQALAESGFTFEYSATFGQAVGTSGDAEVEEEYAKSILFDYSYPRFYRDGYGKDYRIVNLERDLDPQLRRHYLLANLLAFYEQARCYASQSSLYRDVYNIARPLLVFVGHSVTARRGSSQLSQDDRHSLSDVQELVRFLDECLRNEGGWVPKALEALLSSRVTLRDEEGRDLFADCFESLRPDPNGEAIYGDMLQRLFHVSASGGLRLVNLRNVEGEIGLRAGVADRFFGLINIGEDANFLKLTGERSPQIAIEEEQFSGSLFRAINQGDSSLNVLIGSKKFVEGWDSWRVSCMGLMNVGRGEGPQIIQLFGRGVRLLGKGRSLKRSAALPGDHPKDLRLLETLSIFGVRARYMAQFRDYLEKEGIDTERRTSLTIPTRINEAFLDKGLLVMRPRISGSFEEQVRLRLQAAEPYRVEVDLRPRAQALVSSGLLREQPVAYDLDAPATLPDWALDLVDWSRIYRQLWQFREARGYSNLALDVSTLREILARGYYKLYCSPAMVSPASYAGVSTIERLAVTILQRYMERYYTHMQRQWEQSQLVYRPLTGDDADLISGYEAHVKASAVEFLKALERILNTPDALYASERGEPRRVYFDRHLYLPLLEGDPAEVVTYSPPGLNAGEIDFVRALRDYVQSRPGQSLLDEHDCELYLLRNQSRGNGVGFLLEDGQHYFPDFILWLKRPNQQDIVFIDPHGLITAGDLAANPKVQFYKAIKEYEHVLNHRAQRHDVRLHSYIISTTPYDKLWSRTLVSTREEFASIHVYFLGSPACIESLLQDVLGVARPS